MCLEHVSVVLISTCIFATCSMAERTTAGPQWHAAPHLAAAGRATSMSVSGSAGHKDLLKVMKEKKKKKQQQEAAMAAGSFAADGADAMQTSGYSDHRSAGVGGGEDGDSNDQCVLM
eukprot:SAG31_NODE_872_length_11329_cov_3.968655_11_plen_117_part_00